ncbi:hypothetical protein [Luteimonas sp. e5]
MSKPRWPTLFRFIRAVRRTIPAATAVAGIARAPRCALADSATADVAATPSHASWIICR